MKKKKNEEVQNEKLTENELRKIIKEFSQSIYYKAIQQYYYSILINCDGSLRSLDPEKDKITIARTQGVISGLYSLDSYISSLNNKEEEVDIKY